VRHALEPDHNLYANEAPADDLVLGAPALLGIFFAIAVVCAVCFGFGYSAHSGAPRAAQRAAQTSASTPNHVPRPLGPSASAARQDTADENEDLDAPGELSGLPPEPDRTGGILLTQAKPKPAPAAHSMAPALIAHGNTSDVSEETSTDPAPIPNGKPYPGVAVPLQAPLTAPSLTNRPVPAEPAPFEGVMVQIAAVSHAADAQTLATALRHDGFAAIVRASDGDQFFHVQVGPFATREAAKAMRAKLSDNGYNAFVKN